VSRECRIGSLPWWAGVWWFTLGSGLHGAAWGAFYARDGLTLVCYRLCALAGACFAKSRECAREGGAE
jgi:hypothetical protein